MLFKIKQVGADFGTAIKADFSADQLVAIREGLRHDIAGGRNNAARPLVPAPALVRCAAGYDEAGGAAALIRVSGCGGYCTGAEGRVDQTPDGVLIHTRVISAPLILAGLIKGRVALVDHARAKVPVTVFIGVSTSRHEIDWRNKFRALIEEIPEIVEAYRLTGTVDYIVKVVVTDMESYDAVYKQMIQRLEFSQVNSMIAMEELKFTTAVPTAYL